MVSSFFLRFFFVPLTPPSLHVSEHIILLAVCLVTPLPGLQQVPLRHGDEGEPPRWLFHGQGHRLGEDVSFCPVLCPMSPPRPLGRGTRAFLLFVQDVGVSFHFFKSSSRTHEPALVPKNYILIVNNVANSSLAFTLSARARHSLCFTPGKGWPIDSRVRIAERCIVLNRVCAMHAVLADVECEALINCVDVFFFLRAQGPFVGSSFQLVAWSSLLNGVCTALKAFLRSRVVQLYVLSCNVTSARVGGGTWSTLQVFVQFTEALSRSRVL